MDKVKVADKATERIRVGLQRSRVRLTPEAVRGIAQIIREEMKKAEPARAKENEREG